MDFKKQSKKMEKIIIPKATSFFLTKNFEANFVFEKIFQTDIRTYGRKIDRIPIDF